MSRKLSRTVLSGGKGGDNIKALPITIDTFKYKASATYAENADQRSDRWTELKARKENRFSIKQMERTRKSLEVRLNKLNDQSRKDDVICFVELGVDRLFVDEADAFKNLFLYTKMRNVGGIAQTEAQKSSDMFMKCRYLDDVICCEL